MERMGMGVEADGREGSGIIIINGRVTVSEPIQIFSFGFFVVG